MCTFTVCTLFCALNIKLFSFFQMTVRHSEIIRDDTLRDGRHAVPRPLCIIDCQVHRAAARLCEANPCICRHIAFKATDKLPFRLGDVCRHKGPNTGPYRNTKPPPPSLSALQGTEEHLCDCWGDLAPEAEESGLAKGATAVEQPKNNKNSHNIMHVHQLREILFIAINPHISFYKTLKELPNETLRKQALGVARVKITHFTL